MQKKSNIVRALNPKTQLQRLGATLERRYTSKNNYLAVDFAQEFEADVFHKQGGQILGQLFGSKGTVVQNLAKNLLAEDKITQMSEVIYHKIAAGARAWADFSLKGTALNTLSDAEKNALIDDILRQNRALATLGGLAGFLGLKGVVLDTAWLLLVCLKTIYQIAYIRQKPLADKEGVRIAYGILSQCNLDKLQEKQVIMTALAIGDGVLHNAQSTSLADELQKIGQKYQNRSYAKEFAELSKFINLDVLNPAWLHWCLPVVSSVVSAHYNNELISEVFGVVLATFEDLPANPAALLEHNPA